MPETALITLLLAGSLLAPAPARADLGIGVAPQAVASQVLAPQMLASPLHLVAVPHSSVLQAPRERYTLLAYGGLYYSFHRGTWFRSTGPGNRWSLITADQVPNAVLAVPSLSATALAPRLTAATATSAR